MTRLTALDLYIDEINKSCRESGIHFQLYKEGKEYEQAKAMENQQIVEAYNSGAYKSKIYEELDLDGGKKYYNQKYNTHENI